MNACAPVSRYNRQTGKSYVRMMGEFPSPVTAAFPGIDWECGVPAYAWPQGAVDGPAALPAPGPKNESKAQRKERLLASATAICRELLQLGWWNAWRLLAAAVRHGADRRTAAFVIARIIEGKAAAVRWVAAQDQCWLCALKSEPRPPAAPAPIQPETPHPQLF